VGKALGSLLAQPRDDEERIVDPQSKPHRHEHVGDEEVDLEELADHGHQCKRADDREQRHAQRDQCPDKRPEDEQQDDHRRG
jgi:hypothetical protein